MTTAVQSTSGGWVSKLVVVALLALAVGLYLQIVLLQPEKTEPVASPLVSAPVVEGEVAADASGPTAGPSAPQALKDLPADQLELIRQVFAPEMVN